MAPRVGNIVGSSAKGQFTRGCCHINRRQNIILLFGCLCLLSASCYIVLLNFIHLDIRQILTPIDRGKRGDAVLCNYSASRQFQNKNYTLAENDTRKLLSLCPARFSGNHRLGNHMFMLSAMIYIAKMTNRTLVMPDDGWKLDAVFEIDNVFRVSNMSTVCPCSILNIPHYNFDDKLITRVLKNANLSKARTLLVCGLAQTYKYAAEIETELRRTARFRPEICQKSLLFHRWYDRQVRLEGAAGNVPVDMFRVGVHVRRGDFLKPSEIKYGLTVVDMAYLYRAFKYFGGQYYNYVQFIVATDDLEWTNKTISQITRFHDATITHSINNTAGTDLAILTHCDAVIISTGSFGWWAAWLANKPTIYYKDWAKPKSSLAKQLDKNHYFPKNWIPL